MVGNPEDRFSDNEAHFTIYRLVEFTLVQTDDDDFTVSSIVSGLKTRSLGLNTLGTT